MLSFLTSILLNVIFSVLIIYFLHELWEYLKDRFTVKKTIDVFHVQNEKYDKIINSLEKNATKSSKNENIKNDFEKLNQELLEFSESELLNTDKQTI